MKKPGKTLCAVLAIGVSVALGGIAQGAVVQNFNDLTTGVMQGQAGGTGLTGNWAGTSTIDVISGDLDSPLYNRPQSGTPLSVQGDYGSGRQNNRNLASPMSGSIWFSFLVNNPVINNTSGSRGGISFNNASYNPGSPRILSAGDNLVVHLKSHLEWVDDQFAANQTGLVVGRMGVGPGNDLMTVWVDPDLKANTDIWNHTPAYSTNAYDFTDSIDRIGVMSYDSAGGGIVDNVLLSNTQFDVIGVPEPTTLLIWSLLAGLGLGLGWRRRS